MNTSMNNSINDHTDIAAGKNITWVQSPAFARDFNIIDDPLLTAYVLSGDTNVNMNVTIMSSNSASTATIGSFIYQATVVANTRTALNFNVPLSVYNVSIPKGNSLWLRIENRNDNVLTVYQSSLYSSHIDMNTLSYINVNNVSVYDQAGNSITNTAPPSIVKVTTNVTDPFGSFDISNVSVSLFYPNNSLAVGPIYMNLSLTDPAQLSQWKQFERNITLNTSIDTGAYTVIVTANESNSVKSNLSAPLSITYPVYVSAIKKYSPVATDSFLVTLVLVNNADHTMNGVYAYDFYAGDFTVSGFNQPHTTVNVNNAILQGKINSFGPFTLMANQNITITYTAQGIGNYNLANMTIVGVDPIV
jgi:hypothetical protein